MDWIEQGKQLRHFKYPPPLPTDEELEWFSDGLKSSLPKKLEECLTRQDALKIRLGKILKKSKSYPKKEKEFVEEYAAAEFHEYYYIQKWIGYWLQIWSKITKEKLDTTKFNKFEEFELERARQSPFEQIYEGELHRVGKQWQGLCPFHEEKTSSFTIFPDNKAKCFGCGWFGDTIKFVMETKNYTFSKAVRSLL